ncbi:hypothetical protein [Pelomonas cellulosilytica]|uniref:Hydrazine synthase alpha subunit middle domain-containing protein n=1 Tax=Pelomonas cellulosilytica TaxID=2906762 RepID=A0ABS8XP63_9BURK|nr:hypothetical protein [Pelomonas sp. P8]MCE4552918.1 hypothetical protein [Pelomonas sp. P8]
MRHPTAMRVMGGATAFLSLVLAGCGSGDSTSPGPTADPDTLTVLGDVPIAYAKRAVAINLNPTTGVSFQPGGDLIIRTKSSASASEINVTQAYTQGKGDVSDPEASYDGKKIVFSMNCPVASNPLCTGHWNIWEYDMTTGGLAGGTLRRLTQSTSGDDDVDPAYLPAGAGFVFASNRQRTTVDLPSGTDTYPALDEYERERVLNLYTMDAQGGAITQISFNQSHDRNPVVQMDGDIMFSRWDHVGGRNHFKIFTVRPDGTNMFVRYGAHSDGNSFLHPREMDPAGSYKGVLASDLMPLSRTHEGGALVFVDAANFSEQYMPANASVKAKSGQTYPTEQVLNFDRGVSRYGRITTPYPLWDGSNRVLLSYAPCQVNKRTSAGAPFVVTPCANLTDAELASISDDMDQTAEAAATANLRDNVPPVYAVYMFDPLKKTMLIVAAPPEGFIYTDPIALQPRKEPNPASTTAAASMRQALAVSSSGIPAGMGLLSVRSVYDTDGLGRMGAPVLAEADKADGCTTPIPTIAPTDPDDTRAQVADLLSLKDPAKPAYYCSPARFVRVVRAVAPKQGMGTRQAIGETDFEPQQILGYAPIEPDGSFQIYVPADTPLAVAVIDASGRAFQTHTNWIQVRPGETRTCDGCHSPRRGAALNSSIIKDSVPAALKAAYARNAGETMAQTRTNNVASLLIPALDMVYTDVWADTTKTAGRKRPDISLKYTGNTLPDGTPDPANDLATRVPTKGIINYPDHIQPLWSRDRGANTCTNCHKASAKLDLSGTLAGTGRVVSYEKLMLGEPKIDAKTGLPVTHIEDGEPVIERLPALVDSMASEGDALGMARKSRLMEILSGHTLLVSGEARQVHPTPATLDHSKLLNKAELRLLAEFMDLGGKYYNDLNAGGVKAVGKLTQASFEKTVYPILQSTCGASCHQAIGSKNVAAGTNFRQNRFVLTGSAEGDFNVALTMISNVCAPDTNYLLSRPSTVPHPAAASASAPAVLPVGSANYNTIATWIAGGC